MNQRQLAAGRSPWRAGCGVGTDNGLVRGPGGNIRVTLDNKDRVARIRGVK